MIWTVAGVLAALLTSFGFVPQIIRIWRRRSAGDVSLLMLFQFAIGLSLWTAYGIHLKDWIIVAANIAGLAQVIIAIFSVFLLPDSS